MKSSAIAAFALGLASLCLLGCHRVASEEVSDSKSQDRKIVVTSPLKKDVINTQPYVCQIHSRQHIEVRALEGGYLDQILVKEGQAVKKGDLMFKILPTLY